MRSLRFSSPRSIRFWLILLAAVCVLPAVLVAILLIDRSYHQERKTLERDTVATARALGQAIDAELVGIQAVLEMLAISWHLEAGNLAEFYEQARIAMRITRGNNVLLTTARGQQLLNTLLPIGEPLPPRGNPELLQEVVQTGRPAISDLFIGSVTNTPVVAIEVPVIVDGKPQYGLAMPVRPERLGEILLKQKLPAGWVAGVLDRTGTIVARTQSPEKYVGHKASATLLRAMAEMAEGMSEGTTLEGAPVFSSFSRSSISGWTTAIGIPKSVMLQRVERSAMLNGLAAGMLFVLAALLALAIGHRMSRAIAALKAPALALGSTTPVVIPPLDIQEVQELGQALIAARKLIEQRSSERDQALLKKQKLADEFRVLFESSPNGVIVVDYNGQISLLNTEAEKMFGYVRSELVGAPVEILVPERLRKEHASFRTAFMLAPQDRPMGVGRDLFAQRKDGTEFPIEVGLNPVRSSQQGSVMVTVIDISVRKLAEQRLVATTAERDDLRRRIMQAHEQERLRLAHDLHDQTGQSLTAALLELKGMEPLVDESGRERLRLLRKQMEQMGKTLHRVAWELRPASIDDLGLASALANYIAEWTTQYGIAADFHCTDDKLDELPDEVRTTIYRIVQEALSNVVKHAQNSTTVSVVLERMGSALCLMIEDDGCGFDNLSAREEPSPAGGLGIAGMRERLSLIGGELEIESSAGGGATIFARIPVLRARMVA
jgi:PAS domain S-box-containing protein